MDKRILTDLEEGQSGIIVNINGGKRSTKRLADMGLVPGTEVQLLTSTLFSGPIQIKIYRSRLVIGRGLASRIIVDVK